VRFGTTHTRYQPPLLIQGKIGGILLASLEWTIKTSKCKFCAVNKHL
jgi:hypothetical protein